MSNKFDTQTEKPKNISIMHNYNNFKPFR